MTEPTDSAAKEVRRLRHLIIFLVVVALLCVALFYASRADKQRIERNTYQGIQVSGIRNSTRSSFL